jgi:2-O-A-mannosyl-D-glycerate-specific PTS system IIC component
MRLTTITDVSLINIKTTFNDKDEAIRALAEQLNQQGKLHNLDEYLAAVFDREAHGATALGEGLAVPHGKSNAVKEAAFAVATLTQDLKWPGIDEDDEDEDVNLIFLIAIPNAEAGSTHMHLLTALTSTLVDDDVREAVLNAATAEEILAIFDAQSDEEEAPAPAPAPEAKVEPAPAPAPTSEPTSLFGKVAGWFKS